MLKMYLDNVGGAVCEHGFAHVSGLSGIFKKVRARNRKRLNFFWKKSVCEHGFAHVGYLSGIFENKSPKYANFGKKSQKEEPDVHMWISK